MWWKIHFYMTLFELCTKLTAIHFNVVTNTAMYAVQNKLCQHVVGKSCLTALALLAWTGNQPMSSSRWDDLAILSWAL